MKNLLFGLMCYLVTLSCVWADSSGPGAIHGQTWGFGQSKDRYDQIWQKGVDGAKISKNRESKSASKAPEANGQKKEAPRNSLGVTMRKETSSWAVAPNQEGRKIDEGHVRERRNILRAFAGIKAGEDFNIDFGPELILKDEEHSAESANSDQPDSALGLGMKFKLDF